MKPVTFVLVRPPHGEFLTFCCPRPPHIVGETIELLGPDGEPTTRFPAAWATVSTQEETAARLTKHLRRARTDGGNRGTSRS